MGTKQTGLDHTRETVPATVPTAGPAGRSHLLTMDTDPLLMAGMAVFL